MSGSEQWRKQRIADGLCVDCGKPRDHDYDAARISILRGRVPYPLPHAPTATRCSVCAGKHHTAVRANRRKERLAHSPWADSRNGDPLPFGGGAPRLHAVVNVRCRLTRPALDAIVELKRRYRDDTLRAGGTPQPYQLSRIVRETIHRWEHRSGGYRLDGVYFCHRGAGLNVQLDAPTLAIVEREAALFFNGSRAATIRTMLISTANPPITSTVNPYRRGIPLPD